MASDFGTWAAKQRAPVTLGLVASLVGFALAAWATQGRFIADLALIDLDARPWSLFTYPWAYSPLGSPLGLVFLLLLAMWLTQFGGTVEREMGSIRFGLFWLSFTFLPALVATATHVALVGPWLPSAALIVAWGARNRAATVMLYGILPLSGLWLAALSAASILFMFGSASPLVGVLMVLPLGVAWLFANDKLPIPFRAGKTRGMGEKAKLTVVRGATAYDETYFENVKEREIAREEQERLRKLFEGK